MSCVRVLEETTENNKMCLNLQQEEELKQKLQNNNKKRELEKEKSSDSSTNSNSDSLFCAGAGNNAKTSASSGKLSKIGRRLRESCRNLRGKSAPASRHDPEEYTSIQAVNESVRSRHYVAMDFTGKVGKILDNKEFIRGYTSKDGYAYFRKKCTPKNLDQLLTESQAKVHLKHVWFHKGIGRDFAQRILATHNVDGAFLVRESSVVGGFVISYVFNKRTFHAQVLPEADEEGHVFYSLDEGRTKFFDLFQMVEFYQLNKGSLNSRLTHYIVRDEVPRPDSPTSRSDVSTSTTASEASMESQSSQGHRITFQQQQQQQQQQDQQSQNLNNNNNKEQQHGEKEKNGQPPQQTDEMMAISTSSHDLEMTSEGDADSLRDISHQG